MVPEINRSRSVCHRGRRTRCHTAPSSNYRKVVTVLYHHRHITILVVMPCACILRGTSTEPTLHHHRFITTRPCLRRRRSKSSNHASRCSLYHLLPDETHHYLVLEGQVTILSHFIVIQHCAIAMPSLCHVAPSLYHHVHSVTV